MRHSRRIAVIALALLAGGRLLADGSFRAGAERAAAPSDHGAASPEARALRRPAARTEVSPAASLRAGGGETRAGDAVAAERAPRRGGAAREGAAALVPTHAASPTRPRLEAPDIEAGVVTVGLAGAAAAPGERLTLWRVEGGSWARLAQTQADEAGRFRFPQVAPQGQEVAVSAEGAAWDREPERIRLPMLAPGAPTAIALAETDAAVRVRIWPSAGASAVIVRSGGREIRRQAVPVLSLARSLDLAISPAAATGGLSVAEVRAGGGLSAWGPVALPMATENPSSPIP